MMKYLLLLLLVAPTFAQDVYFSPRGGCTAACVSLIDGASKSVLVLAYSFTSAPIGQALINAHKRGVKVQCVVDRSQEHGKKSLIAPLRKAGVPVWLDSKHRIMHEKVLVIDGLVVENGSFNYSAEAESSNAENCLVTKSSALAAKYTDNWRTHQGHSGAVP